MKKTIALLFAGLVSGGLLAGMNNVVITFSSNGPDRYADGTVVADNESYALVWTPTGSTFAGIGSDGAAAGDSKVVLRARVASAGKCPLVQFQVDEEYAAANYPNGTWGVYLLDTRTYRMQDVTVTVDGESVVQKRAVLDADGKKIVTGVGGAIAGYGAVAASIGTSLGGATAGAGSVSETASDIQPPTVKDFKLVDGNAYLYLKGTKPGIFYGVKSGSKPTELKPTSGSPVCAGAGDETIVITPATGSSGFFSGIVQ